jgi:hypothetical protein
MNISLYGKKYIWHDGKNGKPPNNWLAAFGGNAWEWDEGTQQFYYHAFLVEQPDLNWINPKVREAVLKEFEYWLDKGIDGIAKYLVGNNETIKAAFQVKGGKVQSKDTDALLGSMDKHHCELGVFLTIQEPTKPMIETAAASGFAEVPGFKYPRLQILTLAEFFLGKQLKLPQTNITFETAKLKGKGMRQADLL